MIPNFCNSSLIHNNNLIRILNRTQSMSHNYNCSFFKSLIQCIYYLLFIDCIQSICCLIQKQKLGVFI